MQQLRQKSLPSFSVLLIVLAISLGVIAFRVDNATLSAQSLPTGLGVRPLGTFTLGGVTSAGCPTGFNCNTFTVTAPGVTQNIKGLIADQKPTVATRGLIVFFSGDNGTSWWSANSSNVPTFFQSLLNSGFEVVQVAWSGNGWLAAPAGEPLGQEALACRSATVIQWVHDNMYSAPVPSAGIGHCGFCITGNSAGASQITYALASYGIDSVVDAAIPSSGPPMASIERGCLQISGYEYDPSNEQLIDSSYGYGPAAGGGPCVSQDPSFTPVWAGNSVETGGTNYNYPATRIHIIVGGQDRDIIRNHANDYYQVLTASQQGMLTWQLVPRMGHPIQPSSDGLAALFAALTQ
jgi:hypothetical protein